MKCTDILMQEHKAILRALDILEQMAFQTAEGRAVKPEDVNTLLRFLRTFADDHHQVKEESALFPELIRTLSASDDRVRQLKFEHDEERSLVEAVEEALRTKNGTDFTYFADWLARLIRTHIHKEENMLFKIACRALSTEQDERITLELNKFRVAPAVVADLEHLATAYLPASRARSGRGDI